MIRVLIDTSFVVALANTHDEYHQIARDFVSTQQYVGLLPEVALTEIFYVTAKRRSWDHAINMVHIARTGGVDRVTLQNEDLNRVEVILRQYRSARFDFVDAAIMALSERLKITTVLTFDRRDFPIFRPKHTDYLDLLPHLTGN